MIFYHWSNNQDMHKWNLSTRLFVCIIEGSGISSRRRALSTWPMFNSFLSQSAVHRYIPTSPPELQPPQQSDCIPRLISVLIQASHPTSFGSNVKVKQWQSQRDPSVLTSICSALSQFIFSVLFNLCVIWNSQAWRTEDETKCLLSCKYCKWNHDVAPPPCEAFPIMEG